MSGKIRGLQREQVAVAIKHDGAKIGIPVDVYMRPETTNISSMWMHGFGAGPRGVRNTVQAQHDAFFDGASVVMPYYKVPVTELEAFTHEALPQIVAALGPRGKIALGGESRGAGAVALGAAHITDKLSCIGLLEPSYINTQSLGPNPAAAVATMLERLVVENPRRLEQRFHPGAVETALSMAKEMGIIALNEGVGGLYEGLRTVVDPGVSERTIESVRSIVSAGVHVNIYGGTKDALFPYDELKAALDPAQTGALLIPIEAAHVSPGTPEGMRQVQRVMGGLAIPQLG
jgi:hypothetical protein